MKEFVLIVEGTSFITVEAESLEDARQSAIDIFCDHRTDELHVTVVRETEVIE
jgi:hypothetical protein